MPINIDATSSSGYEASLSTYGWSHTCKGRNRLLVVGVGILASGTVTSITYNGKNLTFLRADANGIYRSELWYIVNPDEGINTITVNLSASLTSIAGAASYTGVSQIGAIGATTGANNNSSPYTLNITTTVNNSWVIGNIAASNTALTAGVGNTERWNNSGGLGSGAGEDQSVPSLATVTINWTSMSIALPDQWAISAAEILPAAPDQVFGASVPNINMRIINKVVAY